jgi:hypothetical protein
MKSQCDLEILASQINILRFGKFVLRVHTSQASVEATWDTLVKLRDNEIAEYDKIRALLSEDVWKYYENVLGEDAEDFREVKMLNDVSLRIRKILTACEGIRRVHASNIAQRIAPAGHPPKAAGSKPRGRPRKASSDTKGTDQ